MIRELSFRAVFAEHRTNFQIAVRVLRLNGRTHMKLGALAAELKRRAIPPFDKAAKADSVRWLATYLKGNNRLEPPCMPSQATADTEVWKMSAWYDHIASLHAQRQAAAANPEAESVTAG
jgi:hypothetical protein